MLKSRKNVRKIINRLIIVMAIIVVLGICLIPTFSRAENTKIETMGIEQFGQMKNGLKIADVELGTGTVKPIYRPKWTKVSSSISGNTISVVLKGTASESQTIDSNTNINYSSTVTTNLTADDILVYINGELDGDLNGNGKLDSGETPSITKNVTALEPSTGLTEATHTLKLSGFEGLTRPTGKPYKEWSGNISIKILGRGEAADTYDENTLVDIYGNQSMMETDEVDGTWIDIIYKDDDSTTNTNVSGIMFTDFIKPEFTYISSSTSTIIDHGEEKVTIIFDVVDKYFKETDLASNANGSLITVIVDDNENANTPITKVLTKIQDINYTVNGENAKIGERYKLVITGLDQGDGALYSGPMTLSFPTGIIRDHAGNSNNQKSITLGINEPEDDETQTPTIVDVVDPIWKAENIDINHTNKNVTLDLVAYDKYYASNSLDTGDITVNIDGVDLTTAITDVNVKKSLNTPTTETLIPSEYQQVEYIEGTGTQYIDTNVNVEEDVGVYMKLNALDLSQDRTFFGSYDNGYGWWVGAYSGLYFRWFDYLRTYNEPVINTTDVFDIEFNYYNDGLFESKFYNIKNRIEKRVTYNSPIWLFGRYNGTVFNEIRVYECKITKGQEIVRDFIPCYRKSDNAIGMYDLVENKFYTNAGTGEFVKGADVDTQTIGVRYKLTLSDWQEALRQSGKNYLEWSGTTKIKIAGGTITDQYTNTSNETEWFTLGHVDFIKPEIVEIEPTPEIQAQDIANKTETIVFTATDKYLNTSDMITKDEITIYVDEEDATSALRDDAQLTYEAIDGGYKYTLVIKNLEKTRNAKNYKDWSGTVSIKIAQGAAKDTNTPTANVNDETTIVGDFVDYINPNLKYTHQSTDISTGSKTYTMTFDITDKYYTSGVLTTEDITNGNIEILMQNGQYQRDANGNYVLDADNKKIPIVYNLKDEPVEIALTATEKKVTNVKVTNESTGTVETIEGGYYHLIGHTYTLTISNLEKFEIKNGLTTADYSGVITLSLQQNEVLDRKGNGNVASTITSGISLSEGVESGTATPVDVVDPLWERVSSSANAIDQTATITIRGTDTYFDADDANASTLTSDEIKVFINGVLDGDANGNGVLDAGETDTVTKTLSDVTKLKETRLVNGVETENIQYGVEYTITLTGFAQDVNQVKIRILEGSIKDKSGNGNKDTDMMLYNCLELTDQENEHTDGFLDGNGTNATGIARRYIEQIVFVNSLSGSTAEGVQKVWDVSAQNDGSIKAWTSQNASPYTVYIGSDFEIFANQNSSRLFSNISVSTTRIISEKISGLNLLNTSSVTNMSSMFFSFATHGMENFDLGDNFDTSNVTNMSSMFDGCGAYNMKTIDLGEKFDTKNVTKMTSMFAGLGRYNLTTLYLGDKFDTSNVTTMNSMFKTCGKEKMTTINLGDKFDTSSVTNISQMFQECGYGAMTSLDLGDKFDTSNVTRMYQMFKYCGYTAMTSLDLSSGTNATNTTQFNTSNVTDMEGMFYGCGYTAMATLNLGNNFNTTKVNNMTNMFLECGYGSMTSLDLGDKFDTSVVEHMGNMFNNCGTSMMTSLDLGPRFTKIANNNAKFLMNTGKSGCTIYAPEAIYANKTTFKLNSTSTTTIKHVNWQDNGDGTYTETTEPRGTINPIYKPEWTKESSSIDTTTDPDNPTISINLSAKANKEQAIDANTKIKYNSTIKSNLTTDDIEVYINGELDGDLNKNGVLDSGETPSITKTLTPAKYYKEDGTTVTTNEDEYFNVAHTLTLSNFEQTSRQTGKPFKEWSGNISIKILGRGEATSTYTANTLVDRPYGNQSMMETDEGQADGTWIDVLYKDAEKDKITVIDESIAIEDIDSETPVYMFTDFIKPEFTYESSSTSTIITHGQESANEKVTVVFDVTDKYFKETDLASDTNGDLITVKVDEDENANTPITKTLTKVKDIYYDKTTGRTYVEPGTTGTGTKVGEQYKLEILGLDQEDGFAYSGPMSLSFPANIIKDKSGNKNNAKSITLGINEPENGATQTPTIVDVVDPIWKVENKTTTTSTVDGKTVTTSSMDLIAVDKYFKETTLELNDIQVLVAGVNIAQVDAEGNLTIAPELQRTLSTPVYIKWDYETGTYVENVTQAEANGQKYTYTISNLEESYEKFFEARDGYVPNDESTGRPYREFSGPTTISIPAGTIEDNYENFSNEFTIDLGNIDTLKPEVVKVSSTYNVNADNVELSTHTIVFDIVDKYLDTSAITTTDTSKIHVYLDGEEATTIVKTITNIQQLNATVNGTPQKVGYRYTLELSNFQNPRSSINYDREYTDWSGDLTLKIEANTAYDKNGLGNAETILAGNEEHTTDVNYADFVDYIKPDATYQFSSDDIDATNKKFTMTFDITDKFYHENLSLTELQVLMSAENETEEGEDGYYDLMANDKIGKRLLSEDITNTVNGASKVIGKRYTLELSNLEQLQRIENNYYLDYSGSITLIIPEGSVKDKGPKGDGTIPNGNDTTSIVSGINIPGGEVTDIEIIDVVHPLWERLSFTTDIHNKTATITVLGTDKDFWEDDDTTTTDDKYSTLTTDEIKLFIDGVETTGNITLDTGTKLYEERIVDTEYGDGSLDGELTTETVQYGVRYVITITNFPIDKNQVKIQLTEGSLVDKSSNLSRTTEFLVYNTLISSATETEATSKFLNEIVPEGRTAIQRQDIEKVVFVNSIAGSTAAGVQNVWDASAQRDNSILAWYSETEAPYTVYIGSNDNIYGNANSSNLFNYVGYSESCTATAAVENLNLLHTENIINMYHMFNAFGYRAMTSLDLGNTFDTSIVTNMDGMFSSCGYIAMTSLKLGNKFDTSKVTEMSHMFHDCGYTAMISLDLSSGTATTNTTQFNTSSVTIMADMFNGCGYTAMTTLKLGTNFNTSNVTDMSYMFQNCGYTAMTGLDLSSETESTNTTQFNTSSVTNMSGMFSGCGFTAMTSLNLGNNFDTSAVTNMSNMFNECGYTAMTSLDLEDKFDTSKVENMSHMFAYTGYVLMASLDLGDQFDTSNVTNMSFMFANCGFGTMTNLDLKNKFYTTQVTNMHNMFHYCGAVAMTTLDIGPAFTRIADANTDFLTSTGKTGACTIYAPESIYSSRTAFKLNSTSATTINYMKYLENGDNTFTETTEPRGTINPVYKPEWEQVSTKIDIPNKKISVTLKGYANETFTNGTYTGTYSSEIISSITAGNDPTNLFLVKIDGELDGDVNKNGVLDTGETPSITKTVVVDSETATEVQYTITLSGLEETVRQSGKNFTEWSGNIAIQPVKGTLKDKYGSYLETDGEGNTTVVKNVAGNQNMQSIDLTAGVWTNVEFKDETPTDHNTESEDEPPVYPVDSTMFTDFIKPEFTYEYYNTEIEGDTEANTVIDYTNNKVTVVFDVTDKYFDSTTLEADATGSQITVEVDNDANANTVIQKALTKTGIFVMNKETKVITLKSPTYEVQSTEQKTGERYQLVLTNLESQYGVGYSGVVALSFPAGVITDKSGNTSDAMSITIGIDEPDKHPEHEDEIVVDVVDPIWSYAISDIDRTNRVVNIYILGSDKFYKTNTLTKDSITVYVDELSTTVDTDREGTTANVSSITKVLTPITDATELAELAELVGLTDDIANNMTRASIGYKLTLSTFGVISGQTKVILPAGTIEDLSGNKNRDTTINVGNVTWVEDNEPLEEGDAGYPRYKAFRNHVVDFIKPIITYTYSTVEIDTDGDGEPDSTVSANPDVDYEQKQVTVKFKVTDKYLLESDLINADNTPKNIAIVVDNETVFKKSENIQKVRATISATDITDGTGYVYGKEYTLVVSNLQQNPNDAFKFSGPMQIMFEPGVIEDTSGNTNNAKTITLQTEVDSDVVDVVDPIIMLTEVNGLNLSYRNGANSIDRTLDKVTLRIRATDKYLRTATLQTTENKARVKVKVIKHDGTVVQNAATVESIVKGTQVGGTNPYVEFTITLSSFGANDEGVVSVIIPEGVITDTSGNTNRETEVFVGNTEWVETEGAEYTAFNNSIVDFTDPVWHYSTSSITRDRAGQIGTVTVKLLGKDNYYHGDTLTKEIIKTYVNGAEKTTIEKDLVKITDTAELDGYDTGYILTLSNFGTNEGVTKILLPAGSIRDTSGNGNIDTEILVGNPEWIETDVEPEPVNTSNPKYTAFRDSIVDFIKPVITYQYEVGVNPVIDRTVNAENVKITFNVTDTNFLESNIGLEDIQIFMDVGANEKNITSLLTDRNAIGISSTGITEDDRSGISYTLTLSQFELEEILSGDIFKRHSGLIKLVIAADQVEDTSGNKNKQTTLYIDTDNGDDINSPVIVDFIDPIIYYHGQHINWNDRYAEITLRATDRFYDTSTKIETEDLTLYELNLAGQWIELTDFEDKITITPVANAYGFDFVIKLSDFEEEFKMKVHIPADKMGDTSGNFNQETEIEFVLDNKKPRWQYVSRDTSNFESTGTISFNVKGVDKFLELTESKLEASDLKVLLDGQDITNVNNITISEPVDNTTEKSKSYTINVSGLTTMGTYTLVLAEGTLIDEFDNISAVTTINFSKSAIGSNTDNYQMVTYHVSYDKENLHSSFAHELMSVNTTGTNSGTTTYRPSTLGELNNDGKNKLFAEPFKYELATQTQYASSFAGWAECDENGFDITGATVYGLYDEIPNTVVHLKAVWQDARVVFVSTTEGDNSYTGLSPDYPVADIVTAYSKLNASGTAENNIIVIMDAVEWNSDTVLDKNATITSLYAGTDYRASKNAELKVSSNMQTTGDIIFDNIKLYSDSTTVNNGGAHLAKETYTNMLITNYGDITLGRRITTPTDKYTFGAVIGGNYGTESTTGEIGTHKVRVEAGKYNNIIPGSAFTTAGSTTTSKFVTHEVVIGNMRDTSVSRNNKLTITGYVAMGENEQKLYPNGSIGTTDAYTKTYSDITLYSGTFTGENAMNKATSNIVVYGRATDSETYGIAEFKMYGGNVTGNIYAGTSNTPTAHSEEIVNIINLYGGQVIGDIFGQGGNDNAKGSSDITLQGKINITGNVFGGSNTRTEGVGKVTGNVNITLDSMSATVTGNIYGGSNKLSTLSSAGTITGSTNITLKAGTVQNIYGSGLNTGNTGSTNITIENGTVSGNIYGGAYNGQVETDTNITVQGGMISGNIFGGNHNTTQEQLDNDTTLQNANITIGSSDPTVTTKPTISGNIYGSGIFDKVGTTNIELIKAENELKVFGGSNGNSETTTANITLNGATASVIYGGGQSAGTVTTSNIYLKSGSVTDVYGGGYSANVTTSNIHLGVVETVDEVETTVGTATVTSIYGGTNTAGTVITSNVTLKSGNVTNVFGGGNLTDTETANVTLDGITINTIHGGSKNAGTTTTTNVTLTSGRVTNVFGGGLDSEVTESNVTHQGTATVKTIYGGNDSLTGDGGSVGTSNINVIDSTVDNIYGGNYVKGTTTNANINIQGTSIVRAKLFGGGYKSNIGTSEATGGTTINITGGTIECDINGGSEQGTVYGNTNINIGKDLDTTTGSILAAGNININGNIYGAGSSDLAPYRDKGADDATSQYYYNYDLATVNGNTFITLDNSEDSPITFSKTIYGAGNGATYNNGTTTDGSTIRIKDFGSSTNAHQMTSIERTGKVFISNSFVELLGKKDVTNLYKKTSYTLNRITDSITLYENSTLYTRRGFNKVGGFNSYSTITDYGVGTKATVTITDGVATTNVDNRLYTFEGVNLIFSKEEGPTATSTNWGTVNGMAFFGMYALDDSGNKVYDIYNPNYTGGAIEDFFGTGTYIEGLHKTNHNINRDGFYTNVATFGATTTVKAQVIQPTPESATYYDWIIGAETVTYDVSLIASTSSEDGIEDLVLDYNYAPGATYTLDRVSLNALDIDVNLINPSDVKLTSPNANNTFGLTVETATGGWLNSAETSIYTTKDATDTTGQNNGSFVGDTVYKTDTSTTPGTITFKMYNSVDITRDKDLGYVNLVLTGKTITGEDASQGNTFIIIIAVNLQTEALPQLEEYIPTFTDSAETELHYTTDSRVDLSYLLYKDMDETPYEAGDYRVISTTMQLPVGTKLTLKDNSIVDNQKVYYYHVTATTDYDTDTTSGETRYIYKLSDFFEMDSTTAKYQDITSYYHSQGYVLEQFDLSIDFIDANIGINQLAQETYIELRNSEGVKFDNGERDIIYNLHYGKNAIKTETISNEGVLYSVVENLDMTFTLNVSIQEQKTADGKTIMDTKYYDKIAGIAIEVEDSTGGRVGAPEAQNVMLIDLETLDEYYPDESRVIRIPLSQGISSITKQYKFSVAQINVAPGKSTVHVHYFTSDDGKHFGNEEVMTKKFYAMFVSKLLGMIGVEATNDSRIINGTTGLNLAGNSGVDMTLSIGDAVEQTNIRVELYKRNPTYDANKNYTGTVYTAVNIDAILQGTWETPETYGLTSGGTYEYFLWKPEIAEGGEEGAEGSEPEPQATTTQLTLVEFERLLEQNISTGEYKLVFKSYYEDTLVQTVGKTFIVIE